jgi:hypothetical protein
VYPGSLPPGALAAALGARLGDPGLAALGEGPVRLLLFVPAAPFARPDLALSLPVAEAEPYEKALAAMGWSVRRAGGVLLGGSTAEALAQAESDGVAGAAAGGHDVHLSVDVAALMDAYGAWMQLGAESLGARVAEPVPPPAGTPAVPNAAAAMRLLQLELKAVLLLLNQTAALTLGMDFRPEGVLSDTRMTAREGTALFEFTRQGPPGPHGSAALLSRDAFMTATYRMDAARTAAFALAVGRELARDPQAGELVGPPVLALFEQAGRAFTGEAAVAMRAGADAPLLSETVMKVADEAGALDFMDKAAALLARGGTWQRFYGDLGLDAQATLRRNARRHAGVAVHRFGLAVKSRTAPASEQEKALQAMLVRDVEFALVGGYLVSAQEAAAVDSLIDRARAGARPAPFLRAEQAFGGGRHVYVDYDLLGLMRSMMGGLPAEKGAPNPLAALPATDADPIMYALTFEEGALRAETLVPLRPFALMGEAFKKADAAKVTPAPR